MSIIENFKHQLVCVFDDNMQTKAWHNVADWTIIYKGRYTNSSDQILTIDGFCSLLDFVAIWYAVYYVC